MSHSNISDKLIAWYLENKRDLPWRETTDPFKIWISEIILQQTKVLQGLAYYQRFVDRFSDIRAMADANEDEIMKMWQGLGYYSRARNMHKAALTIRNAYNGVFPQNYNEVLKLKGIGQYTAAAICSFAYNLPYAVVDGNVFRVLSRLFDADIAIDTSSGRKYFNQLANELLDTKCAALHNQAIMEFGALQCVPKSPNCEICTLKSECKAFLANTVTLLPVKTNKIKIKNRYFNYLKIDFENCFYIRQRTTDDIWKMLYELPVIESDHLLNPDDLLSNPEFVSIFSSIPNVRIRRVSKTFKHVLTHRLIFARFFEISVDSENDYLRQLVKVDATNMHEYAISRLTDLYFETLT